MNTKANFLEILDSKYEEIIERKKIKGKEFFYYENINFKYEEIYNKFLCLKQTKTKFIIEEKTTKVKLYLMDSDIIDMIVFLPEREYIPLINSLKNLYKNTEINFKFDIGGTDYQTSGIDYSFFQNASLNTNLNTKADFSIAFYELIHLINLILAKEEFASMLGANKTISRYKRQLVKFISLSEFYRKKEEKALNYLEHIGYDISKLNIFSVYNNPKMVSVIDKKFDIEKFDKIYNL